MTGAAFEGVDIDLLADYIGGALDGTPDESVVAALIADDPAWSAAYESLGGGMALVGAELGRLEAEPMPAELAARLETLFAAPPLTLVRDSAASVDGPHPVRMKERDRKSSARPGRRMKWAAPIAVAAGVIAFVGFGLDYLAGRDGASSDSSTSSAAGLPDTDAAPSAPGSGQTFHSGRDYTFGTLAGGPVQPLTAPGLDSRSGKAELKSAPARAAAGSDAALQRLIPAEALQDCLEAIEQENAAGVLTVDSVDYASFVGTPAVIVRFTADNGSWSWASGPACGAPGGGAATLAKVPVR